MASDPSQLSASSGSDSFSGKQRTIDEPEKILKSHFGTIGIQDIFLSPPHHPFLSSYLGADTDKSAITSFKSWEIVGTIKERPEDFVVRELFATTTSKRRTIPGLTDEDMAKLRIADLLPAEERPQQNDLEVIIEKEKEVERARLEEEKLQKQQDDDSAKFSNMQSPSKSTATSSEAYMQKSAEIRKQISVSFPTVKQPEGDLDRSLNKLSEMALERFNVIASGGTIQPLNIDVDAIWIPPSTSNDPRSEAVRQERGVIFRSLKKKYPLLLPVSVTKNATEKWIRVTIDASYDELIPYLHLPIEDLSDLLLYQKLGIDGQQDFPKKTTRSTVNDGDKEKSATKQHVDGRDAVRKDGAHVVLRLKPGLGKEERRKIHHLIASICKVFTTSTIPDYPLPQKDNANEASVTTTVAVVVSWQKGANKRGGRKRKRNNNMYDPKKAEPPRFPNLLCVIKKRQREHLSMIQKLTQTIRRRQGDIGLAGIKDMQAVTYQFCTFRNTKPHHIISRMKQLERQGIEVDNFYKVDWMLNNGDLDGNEFEIRIRNLVRIFVAAKTDSSVGSVKETLVECEADHIAKMVERIQIHGFVNFFGSQRVGAPGESGATAFRMGQAMLQQNFILAIDILMMGRSFNSRGKQERDSVRRARELWKETKDANIALKALGGGDSLPRERTVLKALHRYGADQPLKALQCISHSIRMFWIHAYQSYVWNQVASKRIELHGQQIVKGDLYVEKDDFNLSNVKVIQDDTDQSLLSFDQIVLPLPGYRVKYPQNDIGVLYQTILEKDQVKFEKSAPAEATAKGAYRRLVVHPGTIHHEIEKEDDGGILNVKLKFQLPKGTYATMLMRELMFTTATRN